MTMASNSSVIFSAKNGLHRNVPKGKAMSGFPIQQKRTDEEMHDYV